MKRQYHIYKLTMVQMAVLILGTLMASCSSFVEVDLPNSQLTRPHVFEDRKTADAAMSDVLASIRNEGLLTGTSFGLSNSLAAYTDELDFYGNNSFTTFHFYNNAVLPSNSAVATYWNMTYNQIYGANAVYEGVLASTGIQMEEANRLQGEALFVRALMHFYLVNLFGDIPYVRTTDYLVNSTVSRNPVSDVYDFVLSDLEQAIVLLPENYYKSGRTRPNKATAQSLMGRVYLYLGAWEKAEDMATTVLSNAFYEDVASLETLFLKTSTETIWQLPPAQEGRYTNEAATFTLFSGPPTTSSLTSDLMTAFSSSDLRKTSWVGEVSNGTNTWYYPRKYRQSGVLAESSEYAIIFRLAEQYLIRAEARAQQNNLIGAKKDLNHIRNRSGLGDTTADSKQAIIESILNERRFEFFTEFGHRFFDLKRLGKLNSVLDPIKQGWNETDSLFPIPEREFGVNPNLLPQNTGY